MSISHKINVDNIQINDLKEPFACVCEWMSAILLGENLNLVLNLFRYLDLRVSTKSGSPDLYFVHAMFAGDVRSRLARINQFLNQNRSECVIIDFQHFYKFTKEAHVQLIQLILEVFGTKLCVQPNPVTRVNLRWMWSRDYQVSRQSFEK